MPIPKSDFTHYASFYGIPCYVNLEDESCPMLAGRNEGFDLLLPIATFIHQYFVQPFFTEPMFPIKVKDAIEK
jgi:hypothetical protein